MIIIIKWVMKMIENNFHLDNHLYVGEKAKKKKKYIIRNLREGHFFLGAYVITPAENGNNILDIYPTEVFLFPNSKNMDFHILGIADSYWEALEVVRQIIDEMYQMTGGFDLDAFSARREGKEKL